MALVTRGAKQRQETRSSGENDRSTWEVFAEGVRDILGQEAECIDIPDGRSDEEIREIVQKAASVFAADGELTLDVTQGFRHFPFLLYALALYLTSLRGIGLRGAYYGMLEGFRPDSEEPRPIVDLRPLLELPNWFHAVRVFRETGSTGPLATLISPLAQTLRTEAKSAGNDRNLHQVASFAKTISDGFDKVAFQAAFRR